MSFAAEIFTYVYTFIHVHHVHRVHIVRLPDSQFTILAVTVQVPYVYRLKIRDTLCFIILTDTFKVVIHSISILLIISQQNTGSIKGMC